MVYHGNTWYTMELHGIPWNYMVYHGILLLFTRFKTPRYIPWNTMVYFHKGCQSCFSFYLGCYYLINHDLDDDFVCFATIVLPVLNM